jgi:hypothetical protein
MGNLRLNIARERLRTSADKISPIAAIGAYRSLPVFFEGLQAGVGR